MKVKKDVILLGDKKKDDMLFEISKKFEEAINNLGENHPNSVAIVGFALLDHSLGTTILAGSGTPEEIYSLLQKVINDVETTVMKKQESKTKKPEYNA